MLSYIYSLAQSYLISWRGKVFEKFCKTFIKEPL